MASRILVAVDLSEASVEALLDAQSRANATGAALAVCHVLPKFYDGRALFRNPDQLTEIADFESKARQAVEERVRALVSDEVPLFIEFGEPYAEIVRRAEAWSADLIVVGSHGRTGLPRLFLGSVAERVLRYAHCRVLVARRSEKAGSVLVATDLSDPSLPAVEAGAKEAERLKAHLVVAHAVDFADAAFGAALGAPFGATLVVPPRDVQQEVRSALAETLNQAVARFGGHGETRILDGAPVPTILHCAHDINATLLVIGTHGRTGLSRVALGSVAERLARAAECSVLAVRLANG